MERSVQEQNKKKNEYFSRRSEAEKEETREPKLCALFSPAKVKTNIASGSQRTNPDFIITKLKANLKNNYPHLDFLKWSIIKLSHVVMAYRRRTFSLMGSRRKDYPSRQIVSTLSYYTAHRAKGFYFMKGKILEPEYLRIPKDVYQDKSLQPLDLKVFGCIYYLSELKQGKCIASNQYLSKMIDCKKSSVQDSLKRLENSKHIFRTFKDVKSRHRKEILILTKIKSVKESLKDLPANADTLPADTDRGLPADNHQKIKSIEDKEQKNPAKQSFAREIEEIIYLFKGINPSVQRLYGNKTERKCVQRMLEIYGREKLEAMIKSLPEVNARPYWPKSTTPYQLEINIPIYKAKNDEEKNKKSAKKIEIINI